MLWSFDIDGTLTVPGRERLKYLDDPVLNKNQALLEWFYVNPDLLDREKVNPFVIKVLRNLILHSEPIVFVTGRPYELVNPETLEVKDLYNHTLDWIDTHVGISAKDRLFMRNTDIYPTYLDIPLYKEHQLDRLGVTVHFDDDEKTLQRLKSNLSRVKLYRVDKNTHRIEDY